MTIPSPMEHSPADIIRQLIVDLGLGTRPLTSTAWPVYAYNEPSLPDDCITVYNTEGSGDGRSHPTGEIFRHPGFQVRVRCTDNPRGHAKAVAIQQALAIQVHYVTVIVGNRQYMVNNVARLGDVINIGQEENSNRKLFVLNGIVTARSLY